MLMRNNKLFLTSVVEFLRRGRVDRGTGGGKVVVVVDSSKRKVTPIFQNLAPPLHHITVQGCIHMPFHSIWRCSNTAYACIMDVWCRVGWFIASTKSKQCCFHSAWPQFSKICPAPLYCYNCVRVHPNTFPHHMKVLEHFICMYYGCVMQSGVAYSLNNDTTTSFLLRLTPILQNLAPPCTIITV